MTEKEKLEDFMVREHSLTKPTGKGFTLGFNDPSGSSYVHVCGGCGSFSDFHKHTSGDFYFCGKCNKIQALKCGCPDPNCPRCKGAKTP